MDRFVALLTPPPPGLFRPLHRRPADPRVPVTAIIRGRAGMPFRTLAKLVAAAVMAAVATPWTSAAEPQPATATTGTGAAQPSPTPTTSGTTAAATPMPDGPGRGPGSDGPGRWHHDRRWHDQGFLDHFRRGDFDGLKPMLDRVPPEQRERFRQNLERWQKMPPAEREALRAQERVRREKMAGEVEQALAASGLQLDRERRDQFVLRFLRGRRQIEEDLQREIEEIRRPRLEKLLADLKAEFAAPTPAPTAPPPPAAPAPPPPAE